MNLGIIGFGRIGILFSKIILQEFPGIGVSVYSPRMQQRFASVIKSPRIKFTTNWPDFLNIPANGFIVASPSATHFDYIRQLVKKSKPIFCEKPLDLSVKKIMAIRKMVEETQVPLSVGFNRRFDPDIMQLKNQIKAGTIGTPHIIRITSRDPSPPPKDFIKSSGGIFLDMVIHDFDISRFLLEDDPISVYAEAEVLVDPDIGQLGDFDTTVTTLKFPKGTLVVIDNSRKAVYGYDQRIEVFGSNGMVSIKNQREHSVITYDATGSHMTPLKHFFMERYKDSYINEIREFLEICAGRNGQMITVQDAYMATKIALSAIKSAKEKKRVEIK